MERRKKACQKDSVILLIDGSCILCHGITRFVIRRDPSRRFRFAAIQSEAGGRLLKTQGLAAGDPDTFVLIQDGRAYTKSAAALRVFRSMPGFWPVLGLAAIVPVSVRDRVYAWIAQGRYRWFGRRENCLLPDLDIRKRFIDEGRETDGLESEDRPDAKEE
ncbi:thiol-disulfide oxidoreductase DCC family protein [Paenibacillus chitinolyticus]|uniref:thiol-disulfide oxidoreductase DCC family protein n=1 Tax=Paenibacillus chitinolyticus TaxID=79263 RepID=UPI003CFDEBB3